MERKPELGARVRLIAGCGRGIGTVVAPFVVRGCRDLDGTYRDPQTPAERMLAVYVRWDEGTRGWWSAAYLARVYA